MTRAILALLALLLTGCSLPYQPFEEKDRAPSLGSDPLSIPDAIPRRDPITRAGNPNPYTVLGKTYHLLPSSVGYQETGIASWYGAKFQGRPTANGEKYNLYAMTAAHKTLPIPCYLEVINLDNGRRTVVRVNDRGPFHDDRIIDLSYAAAVKLGYEKQGTARVALRAIDPDNMHTRLSDSPDGPRYYLQVGAFSSLPAAQQLGGRLNTVTDKPVRIVPTADESFYRVQIGPMLDLAVAEALIIELDSQHFGRATLMSE